jgi:hypothetical protein
MTVDFVLCRKIVVQSKYAIFVFWLRIFFHHFQVQYFSCEEVSFLLKFNLKRKTNCWSQIFFPWRIAEISKHKFVRLSQKF